MWSRAPHLSRSFICIDLPMYCITSCLWALYKKLHLLRRGLVYVLTDIPHDPEARGTDK